MDGPKPSSSSSFPSSSMDSVSGRRTRCVSPRRVPPNSVVCSNFVAAQLVLDADDLPLAAVASSSGGAGLPGATPAGGSPKGGGIKQTRFAVRDLGDYPRRPPKEEGDTSRQEAGAWVRNPFKNDEERMLRGVTTEQRAADEEAERESATLSEKLEEHTSSTSLSDTFGRKPPAKWCRLRRGDVIVLVFRFALLPSSLHTVVFSEGETKYVLGLAPQIILVCLGVGSTVGVYMAMSTEQEADRRASFELRSPSLCLPLSQSRSSLLFPFSPFLSLSVLASSLSFLSFLSVCHLFFTLFFAVCVRAFCFVRCFFCTCASLHAFCSSLVVVRSDVFENIVGAVDRQLVLSQRNVQVLSSLVQVDNTLSRDDWVNFLTNSNISLPSATC